MQLKYYNHLQKLIQAIRKNDKTKKDDTLDTLFEYVNDITNYVSEASSQTIFLELLKLDNSKTKDLKEKIAKGCILGGMIIASEAMTAINELCHTHQIDPIFPEPKDNHITQKNAFNFVFELYQQSFKVNLLNITPATLEERFLLQTKQL